MENKYSPALKEISSRQNHFIQFTRTLKSKKARDIERSTIVEGRFIMQELLDSSHIIRMFFLTRSEYEKNTYQPLIQKIIQRSGRSFLISDSLMEYISLTESGGGFLAVI
jgi:tRNA G18 (ribose-2'-O)-methylase SpoU